MWFYQELRSLRDEEQALKLTTELLFVRFIGNALKNQALNSKRSPESSESKSDRPSPAKLKSHSQSSSEVPRPVLISNSSKKAKSLKTEKKTSESDRTKEKTLIKAKTRVISAVSVLLRLTNGNESDLFDNHFQFDRDLISKCVQQARNVTLKIIDEQDIDVVSQAIEASVGDAHSSKQIKDANRTLEAEFNSTPGLERVVALQISFEDHLDVSSHLSLKGWRVAAENKKAGIVVYIHDAGDVNRYRTEYYINAPLEAVLHQYQHNYANLIVSSLCTY
jgi:hypothetical protein